MNDCTMSVREISFGFFRIVDSVEVDAFAIKFLTCIVNLRKLNEVRTKRKRRIRLVKQQHERFLCCAVGREFAHIYSDALKTTRGATTYETNGLSESYFHSKFRIGRTCSRS